MLKSKTKEELLDMSYDLIAFNQIMTECFNMTFIDKLKSFLKKERTMTKEELIKSLEYINLYEDRKMPVLKYKLHISVYSKNAACRSCSGSNNINNIHRKFQTRVFSEIKNNHPDIISYDFNLKSGKYSKTTLEYQYYPYYALYEVIQKMKNDLVKLKRKGYVEEVKNMENDISTMVQFVTYRKTISQEKPKKESQEISPKMNTNDDVQETEEVVDNQTVAVASNGIRVQKETVESLVVSKDENTNEDNFPLEKMQKSKSTALPELPQKTKKEFSPELGLQLKLQGYSVVKIAKSFGMSRQYVSKKINNYKKSLESENQPNNK
jgi:hypothetical protein